jgi:hypothetical protein
MENVAGKMSDLKTTHTKLNRAQKATRNTKPHKHLNFN